MALTNNERVSRALSLLKQGLAPFVDREINRAIKENRVDHGTLAKFGKDPNYGDLPFLEWDIAALLKLMIPTWRDVFRQILGPSERSFVSEMLEHRNRWAHQVPFSGDDTYRVLDTAGRLLESVSAPQADEVDRLKRELQRTRYEEQARSERRKHERKLAVGQASSALPPWRHLATPHEDVASGKYRQAEFAADLWQVHLKQGSTEYVDPVEFFSRTFLTDSLTELLVCGLQRLAGRGGDPVVQLQTNFGGGKTHSMLALYHLFSGIDPRNLEGIDDVLNKAEITSVPAVKRIVLVGNKISPGNPKKKKDGTVIRTLWGELIWQLGGPVAYRRIAKDDENATNPGDVLRELLNEHGPCLILIDEWVSYARQLHDDSNLPGGSFDTQFTFAQALTESVKAAKKCMLVVSLPASDTAVSPHLDVDDLEVGGQRGREALNRLRNVIGRVETAWKPANAQEGFEIVRRRLFQPLTENQFTSRDLVARQFADLYRKQSGDFPPECRESSYERRIRDAYPIHPEVFDRLYTDWSTIARFQRTRGVLRLMASVIHHLWENGDQSPLILPSSLAIDDRQISSELTRYLPDNWIPTIARDVDGPGSLPVTIDKQVTNLGKYSACRRVARTIYLGSAPTARTNRQGIEDHRIKLGCVVPGEAPSIFGDALRRLARRSTFLYQEGSRYWYDVRPTVAKLAADIAERLTRDPERVHSEIKTLLNSKVQQRGEFSRVHVAPMSSQDIPDEMATRLVVIGADHVYHKGPQSLAEKMARDILENRGNSPRQFRNTLVFLAADQSRLQDLQEAVREKMAWQEIVNRSDSLEITKNQVAQAKSRLDSAETSSQELLRETFQWLLIPVQVDPTSNVEFNAVRLKSHDSLAVRADTYLKKEEYMVTTFAGTRLRMELDRIPLWPGDHVEVRQLVEYFARYPYLQRLTSPKVLLRAISDGVGLPMWRDESFAYADSWAEREGKYFGLRAGEQLTLTDPYSLGLIVKPEIAKKYVDVDPPPPPPMENGNGGLEPKPKVSSPQRFFGAVTLDPMRGIGEAAKVFEEVIKHLNAHPDAAVKVDLEIEATFPDDVSDDTVRTVKENCNVLGFKEFDFGPS